MSYLNLQSLGIDFTIETARARVLVVCTRIDFIYEDIFVGLPCKYLGKLSTKFNKIFLRILSRLTKNVIH